MHTSLVPSRLQYLRAATAPFPVRLPGKDRCSLAPGPDSRSSGACYVYTVELTSHLSLETENPKLAS